MILDVPLMDSTSTTQNPGPASKPSRKTTKKEKPKSKSQPKEKVSSVDYEQRKKDSKDSDQTTKKKKPSVKLKTPAKSSDVDVNAVPNPNPDTGLSTLANGSYQPTITIHSGILPVIPSTAMTSGFSPLPPLAAFATSFVLSSSVVSSNLSTPTLVATAVRGSQSQAHTQAPKHLPTVIIVLLAVGAAFFLVGAFIIYRMCSRPRKHTFPTPSLPILQDPFQDEKPMDPEEESLFGGKERSSARPESNGVILTWTKYPHTSVNKPEPTLDVNGNRPGTPPKRTSADMYKGTYPFAGPSATASSAIPTIRQPVQQIQNVITRATNRVSAMSMSVYPGSPISTSGHGVGVAISGSPLTADGLPVLQRSNSKPTARRMSKAEWTARQSVYISNRLTVPNGLEDSDLYNGSEAPSPILPTVVTPKSAAASSTSAAGRARVKAPYAPATLLRASATLPGVNPYSRLTSAPSIIDEPNPFEESQYVLPPISPMMKSDDRRERDTQALTNALGLVSPRAVPPSPQNTLYPDDSITLAGDKDRRRSRAFVHGRAASQAGLMSPGTDGPARLGQLMLGDFQGMASLPSARTVGPSPAGQGQGNAPGQVKAKSVSRKRVEEMPPRVPSPPTFPSLAQMAMAHHNPDGYEDYRSPTYSIYGLYEADRKSRAPGEGGY